jgi:hypothetical protein
MKVSHLVRMLESVDGDFDVAIEQFFTSNSSGELKSIAISDGLVILRDHKEIREFDDHVMIAETVN